MTTLLIPDHNGAIALALAAALLLTAGIIRHLIVEAWREDMAAKAQADVDDAATAADWQARHPEPRTYSDTPLFDQVAHEQMRAELADDETYRRWFV